MIFSLAVLASFRTPFCCFSVSKNHFFKLPTILQFPCKNSKTLQRNFQLLTQFPSNLLSWIWSSNIEGSLDRNKHLEPSSYKPPCALKLRIYCIWSNGFEFDKNSCTVLDVKNIKFGDFVCFISSCINSYSDLTKTLLLKTQRKLFFWKKKYLPLKITVDFKL